MSDMYHDGHADNCCALGMLLVWIDEGNPKFTQTGEEMGGGTAGYKIVAARS